MNGYLQGGDPMYNFPNDTQMTVEKTLKANTSHPDTHFQRCIRRARRKAFAASEDVEWRMQDDGEAGPFCKRRFSLKKGPVFTIDRILFD